MSMGRMYSILMDAATTVAAAQDLISITAPADAIIIVHEAHISRESSEVSDTAVAQIHRGSGSAGAGGANTPIPLDLQSPAMGGTVLHDLTTDETEGVIFHRRAFNLISGFHWLPTPEMRIVIPPSGILCLRSDIAITSCTLNAELIVEEIG